MSEQWHLHPDSYLDLVRSEIPSYDDLQAALARATSDVAARSVLDLGSGTGVTAAAVASVHPAARLVGLDESEPMLRHAREAVPQARFVVGRLEDPLPPGPFDLVVSAFAVHHLDGPGKEALFRRIASVLAPGGRFVLCDVVVPEAPVDHPVPLEPGHDRPSRLAEVVGWLAAAGLEPTVLRVDGDLALLAADRAADDPGAERSPG